MHPEGANYKSTYICKMAGSSLGFCSITRELPLPFPRVPSDWQRGPWTEFFRETAVTKILYVRPI